MNKAKTDLNLSCRLVAQGGEKVPPGRKSLCRFGGGIRFQIADFEIVYPQIPQRAKGYKGYQSGSPYSAQSSYQLSQTSAFSLYLLVMKPRWPLCPLWLINFRFWNWDYFREMVSAAPFRESMKRRRLRKGRPRPVRTLMASWTWREAMVETIPGRFPSSTSIPFSGVSRGSP